MRIFICVALAAFACGKSDKAANDKVANDKVADDKAKGPERVSNQTLVKTPLQNVASTAATVAFTIDLPMAELKPSEVKDAYSTWEPKKAWFDTPSFTVVFSDFPMSPDSKGPTEPIGDDAKDRVIARNEKLPDGGYIALDKRTDQKFFVLQVCRPVNNGGLCCSVSQRADKPIEAFDEIVAFAEKVCRSMKAKG